MKLNHMSTDIKIKTHSGQLLVSNRAIIVQQILIGEKRVLHRIKTCPKLKSFTFCLCIMGLVVSSTK